MAPQLNLLDAKLIEARACADHISVVALRKAREVLRRPADIDGWEAFKFETVADAYLIEGGVPRLLQTGPRRGQKTWRGSRITRVIVTKAEVSAERRRYEAETGSCARCMGSGSGEVLTGWSRKGGDRLSVCPRCHGTKHAPNDASEVSSS